MRRIRLKQIRVRKLAILIVLLGCGSTCVLAQDAAEPLPARPVAIDRDQVFVGKREFRVINAGEDAGLITVHSRFTEAGQYLIHDHSVSEFMGVNEELLMLFDAESFAPVRVQVHGRIGTTYMDINWEWDGLSANGKADTYNFESGAHAHHDLNKVMPEGTLTRGAALFLLNAMDLEVGNSINLNWFNTQNGQIKPITFAVEGTEKIVVPAGSFETLRVVQTGGQPGNTIYITLEKPRRIVRIDVTGTEMQLHLLSLEP